MIRIDQEVSQLRGIGPRRAQTLERLGVVTVEELLEHLPRRYLDYRLHKPISDLASGDTVTVRGRVIEAKKVGGGAKRNLVRLVLRLTDGTGELDLIWFFRGKGGWHRPFPAATDEWVVAQGTIQRGPGGPEMVSPLIELGEESSPRGMLPVYPTTAGVTQGQLRDWIGQALLQAKIPEILPESVVEREELLSRRQAFDLAHRPKNPSDVQRARNRLAFEELFALGWALRSVRRNRRRQVKPFAPNGEQVRTFLQSLPFRLTRSQAQVIEEIGGDMLQSRAMDRLLQGDVGAGKTVVAAYCLVKALENGRQAAFMAPTQILAEQQAHRLKSLIGTGDIEVLTGSVPGPERLRIREGLARGEVKIVVGTHTLVEEELVFDDLGVVVVDEQHRFGVRQRAELVAKGTPHTLLMTATPIPRTLAMTVYGDLDVSYLREKPPGRLPVDTRVLSQVDRDKVYRFLCRRVQKGEQAYVVVPSIEGEQTASVSRLYEELTAGALKDLRVEKLHGQMSTEAKDEVMYGFARGEIQVLVATTVIEVGVDVEDATVLVVEEADRFGLAQLHQLRGRVGRGHRRAYALLVSDPTTVHAQRRLEAIRSTADGFVIAEQDLKLRGPGESFGLQQTGFAGLRTADLTRDAHLLQRALRAVAAEWDGQDFAQSPPELAGFIRRRFETAK